MHIVDGVQTEPQRFLGDDQMAQIGSRKVLAGIAPAALLDGPWIVAVAGVAQVEAAIGSEHGAVPG